MQFLLRLRHIIQAGGGVALLVKHRDRNRNLGLLIEVCTVYYVVHCVNFLTGTLS